MTDKERTEYAKQFANTNRKFGKTHYPKVKRQLDKVVSSLIGTIKKRGPRQALVDLQTMYAKFPDCFALSSNKLAQSNIAKHSGAALDIE